MGEWGYKCAYLNSLPQVANMSKKIHWCPLVVRKGEDLALMSAYEHMIYISIEQGVVLCFLCELYVISSLFCVKLMPNIKKYICVI